MTSGVDHQSGRLRWSWLLFRAALVALPWVGIGVARLVTGRDLGGGLQPAWVLTAGAMVLAFPELLAFLRQQRRGAVAAAGPFAAALVLSALGLWLVPAGEGLAAAFLKYFKQIIQLAVMAAFVVMPAFYMVRGRSLAELALPIVAGALLQVLYGIGQAVHFEHPLALMTALERVCTSNPSILAGSEQLYLGNVLREIPRLRGTACEPLYLGNFLLLALALLGCVTWSRRWRLPALLSLLALLAMTWSRGAWLAAAGGLLVFLVLARRAAVPLRWRRLGRLGLLGVAVLALLGLAAAAAGHPWWRLPWERLEQSFSTLDWSNLTRLYSMQAAWRAFLLSPLVGIGWGQFGFHFAALVDPLGLQSMFTWPVVNNFPLAILCETGALGMAGFVWGGVRLGRRVAQRVGTLPPAGRLPVVLAAAGTIAVWIQLLTFSQYNLPHIWVALGLLAGVVAAPGPQESGEPS